MQQAVSQCFCASSVIGITPWSCRAAANANKHIADRRSITEEAVTSPAFWGRALNSRKGGGRGPFCAFDFSPRFAKYRAGHS